jgi:hypothetical protein
MQVDHIHPSLVHDFFEIQSIGKILLVLFKGVFPKEVYKNYETKSRKTWYSLT